MNLQLLQVSARRRKLFGETRKGEGPWGQVIFKDTHLPAPRLPFELPTASFNGCDWVQVMPIKAIPAWGENPTLSPRHLKPMNGQIILFAADGELDATRSGWMQGRWVQFVVSFCNCAIMPVAHR